MTAHVPDTPAPDMSKFLLEKTYASFFEAGSRVRSAFVYMVSFAMAANLLVNRGSEAGTISIPFLGLSVGVRVASSAFLVLSSGAFLVLSVMWSYERWLGMKLRVLMEQHSGNSSNLWSLAYPSFFNYVNFSSHLRTRNSFVAHLLGHGATIGTIGVFQAFLNIDRTGLWDAASVTAAILSGILISLGYGVAYRLTPRYQESLDSARSLIDDLERLI